MDRQLVIWKSDRSDKNKAGFHPICDHASTNVWLHHLGSNETDKKLDGIYAGVLQAV